MFLFGLEPQNFFRLALVNIHVNDNIDFFTVVAERKVSPDGGRELK
jgi:hypothetical protein